MPLPLRLSRMDTNANGCARASCAAQAASNYQLLSLEPRRLCCFKMIILTHTACTALRRRSRNFVRSPSATASALVRLLGKIMALRRCDQSIRRNRVSGGPTWSEGHCLRIRVTMTLSSWPTGQILRKAAAPPRAFAALATCTPLSGCVLSAGEPELGCYISSALAS